MVVDVVLEERYWYPDDGGIVWVAGYQLVDPASGRYLGRDAPEVVERGLLVAGVAGAARHHGEALALPSLVPGSGLELRRDADNPHDPNAIAVMIEGQQLGWVPRELAVDVAPGIDAGREWSAVVLREQRPSPRDDRTGVTMLLVPAATIELRVGGLSPPSR